MPRVEVEFYGIARSRAGVAGTAVDADTVRAALDAVVRTHPGLGDVTGKHFLYSINGERFVTNLDEDLAGGTRLLLLSADAGG
jgi:molybdopterin converting factor small subunit